MTDHAPPDAPTEELFDGVVAECREIFAAKLDDYGPSLLVFRTRSLVDKLWIKAQRVRELETVAEDRRVDEGRREEFLAMVNYSVVALVRLWHPARFPERPGEVGDVDPDAVLEAYDEVVAEVRELLLRKDHDYGEAWREMAVPSITDVILDKILRLKRRLDGDEQVSDEDLAGEFGDILNYAVFSVAKLDG